MDLPAGSIEFVKGKLFFLSCEDPSRIQGTLQGKYAFINTDNSLVYTAFFADFGPLDLGLTYSFCQQLQEAVRTATNAKKSVVQICSNHPHRRANAAVLMMAYLIFVLEYTAEQAYGPLIGIEPPFISFRDAAFAINTFPVTVLDCARAFYRVRSLGHFSFKDFSLPTFRRLVALENGDISWIIPGKFIAFSGPINKRRQIRPGVNTLLPEEYVPIFKSLGVTCIVRFNSKCYDRNVYLAAKIRHVDLYYEDGANPPESILQAFLQLCEGEKGVIAVHCKAGLGRTGTNIAAYMIKHYGYTAKESTAWCRVCRPGSVVGPQQQYLMSVEARLKAEGELFRQRFPNSSAGYTPLKPPPPATLSLVHPSATALVTPMGTTSSPTTNKGFFTGFGIGSGSKDMADKGVSDGRPGTSSTANSSGGSSGLSGSAGDTPISFGTGKLLPGFTNESNSGKFSAISNSPSSSSSPIHRNPTGALIGGGGGAGTGLVDELGSYRDTGGSSSIPSSGASTPVAFSKELNRNTSSPSPLTVLPTNIAGGMGAGGREGNSSPYTGAATDPREQRRISSVSPGTLLSTNGPTPVHSPSSFNPTVVMTPIRGGANGTGSNGGGGIGTNTMMKSGGDHVRDQFERDVAAVATAMNNGSRISGGGAGGGVGSGPSSAFEQNCNNPHHRRVSGTTATSGGGGGSLKTISTGPLLTSQSNTWKNRDELASQSGHGLTNNEMAKGGDGTSSRPTTSGGRPTGSTTLFSGSSTQGPGLGAGGTTGYGQRKRLHEG